MSSRAALAVVRAHPRHLVLAAVVAGLLTGGWMPALAPLAAAVAGVAALRLTSRAPLAALAAVAALGGAAAADARREAIDRGVLPARLGAALATDVTVLEPPHRRASGETVARARLPNGEAVLLKARESPAAGASARPLAGTPVGAIVAVRGRLVALREFDELQRRRGALAALAVASVSDTGRRRGGIAGVLDGVRVRARRGMAAGLAPAEAALAHGMVLGDDSGIADEVRDDFRTSGLAHLLAASGTNVMLLATLVLGIGALAGVRLRPRLAIALVAVAAYVPLAGAGPSIQRAGIMGAAGLVAALAGRPASRWYAVGLAAAATLALNPYAAADPGWQLSFAAVIGLATIGRPLGRALAHPRLPGALSEAAAMTIAATIATAPLLALHFESLSLASLPANVLAAPAVAPLMWLGTLAGTVGQVAPGAAVPLNALNAYLLGFIGWVAHATAQLPGASLPVRLPGPLGVAAAYAALAAAAFAVVRLRRSRTSPRLCPHSGNNLGDPRPKARGPLVALVLAAAVAIPSMPQFGPPQAKPGQTIVSFLDIGQGDATLIQRDGASILFDTGPPDGPIVKRLKQAGVTRLDALVITHAQLDHEGAATKVVKRFKPRLILNGGFGWPTRTQAEIRRTPTRKLIPEAGQHLRLGALTVAILWPPRALMRAPPTGDPNNRAVVALLTSGSFDLLLPADAESDVLNALPLKQVEALKVSHHGSADSGLPRLLETLRPQTAAIEVGDHNTYGHPTPSTLQALKAVPHVYRTDRDGTVSLRIDP